jgi:hypothetical protein
MAIVIRSPKDEMKKEFLLTLVEKVRKEYSIKCGTLTKNTPIRVGSYKLELKEGDHVIFYGEKPELVQELGRELKKKGYEVLFIDGLTIALLLS